MGSSAPTPPREDHGKLHGSRKPGMGSKPLKTTHRGSKRASTHAHAHAHSHQHQHQQAYSSYSAPGSAIDGGSETGIGASSTDGRHRRVWKACERCRMKKTKCDGEFPCKRCKDDGLVCTAGVRKKTEYKQIPRGYAEVLEHTQFALVATVHKLYAMVRNSQPWELGEPELNDRGQPVIHNIASKLGCIRPNSDVDLPVRSAFPEDEAGLAELISRLEAQEHQDQEQQQQLHQHQHQHQQQQQQRQKHQLLPPQDQVDLQLQLRSSFRRRRPRASNGAAEDRGETSSSDMDGSDLDLDLDLDQDYRRIAFGGDNPSASALSVSPQSLTHHDFDARPGSSGGFSSNSPATSAGAYAPSPWSQQQQQRATPAPAPVPAVARASSTLIDRPIVVPTLPSSMPAAIPVGLGSADFLQQADQFFSADLLRQGLLESEFGALKPHVLSCPNPEVMLGIGDPMIYSPYEADPLRL